MVEKAAASAGTSPVERLGRSVRDRGCGRLLLRVEVVMAPEPTEGLCRMSLGRMSGRFNSWRTRSGCRAFIWWRGSGTIFQDGEIYLRVSGSRSWTRCEFPRLPDEENGMVWERLVENWHEEHWERRTPWRGSSNFRVLRRAGPETSGSSSKVMMADKATQTLNKENKATQTDLPNDKARRFFKEFQKQTDNQG